MDGTNMTSEQTGRQVPAWVFLLVILLCIAGGIAFVTWYFKTSNPISESVVLKSEDQLASERQAAGREVRGRGARPDRRGRDDQRARRDAVIRFAGRQDGATRWRVIGHGLNMTVTQREGQEPSFSFRYVGGNSLLDDQQRQIAALRWRVLRDRSVADHLKITDEQIARLRELPVSNDIVVPEEQLAQMRQVWATVQPPQRNREAERQILSLLQGISSSAEQPTRENWAQQIARIREVLTDEQVAAFAAMGRNPRPAGGG